MSEGWLLYAALHVFINYLTLLVAFGPQLFCEIKCYVKIWCTWLVGPHLRSQLGITYQSHRP